MTRSRRAAGWSGYRWAIRAALFSALLGMLVPAGSRAATPKTSEQLRSELEQLQREKARLEKERSKVQARVRDANRQRQSTETRLRSTANDVDTAARRVRTLITRLGEARQALEVSKRDLERHLRDFAQRIDLMYRYGEPSTLELLLSAKDFADFSDLSVYRQAIMQQDAELTAAFEESRDRAIGNLAKVDQLEENAKLAHEILRHEKSRLTSLAAEHTAEWQNERARLRVIDQRLAQLEAAQRNMTSELDRLSQTAEGRARAARTFTGGFVRPVPGSVSSPFGWRERHPIYGDRRFHAGVDLRAASGSPIKAAATGVVIVAGWRSGYGNTVVIDHGGGVTTLYAHCSSLYVHEGQSVKQGQTIAAVGSTGAATGPHLHWEVRKNGVPTQPPL